MNSQEKLLREEIEGLNAKLKWAKERLEKLEKDKQRKKIEELNNNKAFTELFDEYVNSQVFFIKENILQKLGLGNVNPSRSVRIFVSNNGEFSFAKSMTPGYCRKEESEDLYEALQNFENDVKFSQKDIEENLKIIEFLKKEFATEFE